MAQVLLEGIYRKWVEIPNVNSKEEAYEAANNLYLGDMFDKDETIRPEDIEDLTPVDYDGDEEEE